MTTSSSLSGDLKLILHEQDRLRIWSVIITIMGEVVDASDGEISLDELVFMCGLMDVEQQAARIALDRLSREGWLVHKSEGNSVIYRFSTKGLEETRKAMEAVYRPPRENHVEWGIGILPAEAAEKDMRVMMDDLARVHPIIMNGQVVLWEKQREDQIEERTLKSLTRFCKLPREWPESLWHKVVPSPQVELVNQMDEIVTAAGQGNISAEEALIIRILLTHFWRRLVLWHPPILSPFDETLWPLPKLHRTIANNYHQLCEKSDAALSRDPDLVMRGGRFNH
jgi:phenylacetic acid degradation operon negative regulatory protein